MSYEHLILRVMMKVMFPFIVLFALYVQFHGDYGPGGGFQAGVIFAVAFILHALVFGLAATKKALPQSALSAMMASGVLLYAGTGVVTMLLGGNLLGYDALAPNSTHHAGQHYGIIVVELGVGLAVASTMLTIFYLFAGREPDIITDDDW
ncbi:MAG: Na(+)/H(+) antiporter subunit B [Parvularculaceae bacterium]